MAENLYRALWAWLICIVVTALVSLVTKPKAAEDLKGLVYGFTELPRDGNLPLYKRPLFWGAGVGLVFVILQWIFW
jgi:SSS family solute:Na+ symporter